MARLFLLPLLLIPLLGVTALQCAPTGRAHSVIVKFRSDGPHALDACAETRALRGQSLVNATADASPSLDALMQRHSARRVRAIFRRPDGSPIANQEEQLRTRFRRARNRNPMRALRSDPPQRDPGKLAHVYRMELRPDVPLGKAIAEFSSDPHVEYIQPNYLVAQDRELNDPFLSSSGSWGQFFADLYGLEQIGARAAWDQTLGEGTIIAIVDTGIDTRHPDLIENLWVHPGEDLNGNGVADPEERNGIDDDGNGFIDDLNGFDFHNSIDQNEDGDFTDPEDTSDADPFDGNGHGTHVAGIAAGRGNNGIGISGVAPRARIMGVKIFPSSGGSAEEEKAWRGVLYAAENGADVINASWSCSPRCPDNPLGEEMVRLVRELGVVFVTSAGNRADDAAFTSPERLPETITVGATREDGNLAKFSSFGWVVDVVAPGDDILSLRIEDARLWSPNRFVGDAYMRLDGTSMSTPHVTGTVALMLSADPTLTVDEIRGRLRRTAADSGLPGPDRTFGQGLLRADLALQDTARPDAYARFDPDLIGARLESGVRSLTLAGTIRGNDVAATTLEFGEGPAPTEWTTIASLSVGPFAQNWDVSELGDGPYLLRITVDTRDGNQFTEMAPVSLDRNPPVFLSPVGFPARDPDVAGDRVVWSARRISEGPFVTDLDLEIGTFGTLGGTFLDSGSGDQFESILTPLALVFGTRPIGASANDRNGSSACLQRRGTVGCSPTVIAADPAKVRTPASVVGRKVVYGEKTQSGFSLLLCRITSRPCMPRTIAPPLIHFPEPQFDGRRVLYAAREGTELRLNICQIPPLGKTCVPQATDIRHPFHLSPKALANGIVLYEDIDIRSGPAFSYRLWGCALEPATGACPPVLIQTSPGQFELDFSEGRIVWSEFTESGSLDILFCRFDAIHQTCPIQRLSGDPSRQSAARIDEHRVVWEDDREGEVRIASFALPTLGPLRPQQVNAGRPVAFEVVETSGVSEVQVTGLTETGAPLASLGVRITQAGPGRSYVRWRPGDSDVGTHVFLFRVSLPSGLMDERAVQIDVLPSRINR